MHQKTSNKLLNLTNNNHTYSKQTNPKQETIKIHSNTAQTPKLLEKYHRRIWKSVKMKEYWAEIVVRGSALGVYANPCAILHIVIIVALEIKTLNS